MDRESISGKCLAVGIILLFVGAGIVPSTAKPIVAKANTLPHPGNLFGLNSNIIVSWDANETQEPIIPRGELRRVHLQVLFSVTWGIFGRLINRLLRYEPVIMTLSVEDTPEWCSASLSQGTLQVVIPQDENTYCEAWTQLSVMVDDQAPAFELCPVTIQTTIEPLHGLFGFIPLMHGTTQVVHVTFLVGYKSLIAPYFPQTNIIETPPLVQVELLIGIENLGNGRTIVVNEVVGYPDGWIVSIPAQLVLEVGESKEMNLSIIAPSDFSGEASITVSFTPHSSDNYSLVGQTLYVTILAYYQPP